jgi:hypothetical protein
MHSVPMVKVTTLMRRRIGIAAIVAALIWALGLSQGVANASVSSAPPATPQIGASATSGTDGTIEVVRQLTQCGDVMYAVGTFTQVRNPNTNAPIARNNAFAFLASRPYTVTAWNPNVNGSVDTAACAPDGNILLGGSFTTVGGVATRNLAKVNPTTGAQVAFGLHPAGRVAHMEVVRDQGNVLHLLVGGYAAPFLRSLDPVTGANQTYLPANLAITGTYQYTDVAPHTTRIYNMSVFPAPYQPGSDTVNPAVLMTGVFTSVGGQHHEQVFRLNLTPGTATVSGWSPSELYAHCVARQPFYAQDAAWSSDGTQIFVVTTGFHVNTEQRPVPQHRVGPCDAAIAYPTTEAEFAGHTWINYTGCDSLYAVATDASTVFIGGHQRWISNGEGCDRQGPGGRAQPGLGELTPTTGVAQTGPSRGRGLGAGDLLRTSAGLWIASDNQANTATCGTASARMGICFLPN